MHAPPQEQPRMPPREQPRTPLLTELLTHASENITLRQLHCGPWFKSSNVSRDGVSQTLCHTLNPELKSHQCLKK